jgi:hypothetical protein
MEIRERVQAQLGRVEEETKRLALIREVCIYIGYFIYKKKIVFFFGELCFNFGFCYGNFLDWDVKLNIWGFYIV